jgi:hypothetical protein
MRPVVGQEEDSVPFPSAQSDCKDASVADVTPVVSVQPPGRMHANWEVDLSELHAVDSTAPRTRELRTNDSSLKGRMPRGYTRRPRPRPRPSTATATATVDRDRDRDRDRYDPRLRLRPSVDRYGRGAVFVDTRDHAVIGRLQPVTADLHDVAPLLPFVSSPAMFGARCSEIVFLRPVDRSRWALALTILSQIVIRALQFERRAAQFVTTRAILVTNPALRGIATVLIIITTVLIVMTPALIIITAVLPIVTLLEMGTTCPEFFGERVETRRRPVVARRRLLIIRRSLVMIHRRLVIIARRPVKTRRSLAITLRRSFITRRPHLETRVKPFETTRRACKRGGRVFVP